jgi:hypothetical protein
MGLQIYKFRIDGLSRLGEFLVKKEKRAWTSSQNFGVFINREF